MAIRNSYPTAIYGPDEIKSLEVTIAHEFFHSVQISRNAYEKSWLFEGQATAMETVIYPNYNDNHQYLGFWSQFPHVSISYVSDFSGKDAWEGHEYGIWPTFFRGQDKYGWDFQKEIIEASVSAGTDSSKFGTVTINKALEKFGSDLSTLMASAASAQILWNENIMTEGSYKNQSSLQKLNTEFKIEADLVYQGSNTSWASAQSLQEYGMAVVKVKSSRAFSVQAASNSKIDYFVMTYLPNEGISSFGKSSPQTAGNILNRDEEDNATEKQYYVFMVNHSQTAQNVSLKLTSFDSTVPNLENQVEASWSLTSEGLALRGEFAQGEMKIYNSKGSRVWSGLNKDVISLSEFVAGKYFWINSLGKKIPFQKF
jgi:hypothetical protein